MLLWFSLMQEDRHCSYVHFNQPPVALQKGENSCQATCGHARKLLVTEKTQIKQRKTPLCERCCMHKCKWNKTWQRLMQYLLTAELYSAPLYTPRYRDVYNDAYASIPMLSCSNMSQLLFEFTLLRHAGSLWDEHISTACVLSCGFCANSA